MYKPNSTIPPVVGVNEKKCFTVLSEMLKAFASSFVLIALMGCIGSLRMRLLIMNSSLMCTMMISYTSWSHHMMNTRGSFSVCSLSAIPSCPFSHLMVLFDLSVMLWNSYTSISFYVTIHSIDGAEGIMFFGCPRICVCTCVHPGGGFLRLACHWFSLILEFIGKLQ